MTSKEKVLKIYPRAWSEHVDNVVAGKWWHIRIPYGEITKKYETEEAAWQNAAESLPAEPEHCPNCNHKAHYALRCGALIATGSDGEFAEEVRCECLNWVAEPKPTPSTPIDEFAGACDIVQLLKLYLQATRMRNIARGS